jgi:hypothetical protein
MTNHLASQQVWNRNFFKDEFMGQCVLSTPEEVKASDVINTKGKVLYGKGKKDAEIQQPGTLHLTVIQSRNLYAI